MTTTKDGDVFAIAVMTVAVLALLRGLCLMCLLANLHVVGLDDQHPGYLASVGFAFLLSGAIGPIGSASK